ncbi:MAG: MBL fold metallo-hydrolase [Deltaproteobacteria bacterium]|nr:MBL fold metallo-hydrolase [Deltaproteobacteria bacterium]
MRELVVMMAVAACGSKGSPASDGSVVIDASGDAAVAFDPGPEPTGPLMPVPGELAIHQLFLPIGFSASIGESAIIVGPDGTLVLLDVGNGAHDDDVRAEVRRLNTQVLTPARGYAARGELQVEWIVTTHFHGDHIGGLDQLLTGSEALAVVHGVVHRGFVDVGDALNPAAFQSMCQLLRGSLATLDRPLCRSAQVAPCAEGQWTQAYPAIGCDGLLRGDLATGADDAAGAPTFISLGGGARMTLIGAAGYISDGQALHPAPSFAHDMNGQENARSVIGIVEHGFFRYHFAGDLTGHGDVESPDVESHLAAKATSWYGPRGIDVSHAHHHARRTSSNTAFVDRVTPADGRSRNIVAGINEAYIGSPAGEVLSAFGDLGRLGTGRIWVTATAANSDTHATLEDADGPVIVQTVQQGRGYWIQAAGAELRSRAYPSVRAD